MKVQYKGEPREQRRMENEIENITILHCLLFPPHAFPAINTSKRSSNPFPRPSRSHSPPISSIAMLPRAMPPPLSCTPCTEAAALACVSPLTLGMWGGGSAEAEVV